MAIEISIQPLVTEVTASPSVTTVVAQLALPTATAASIVVTPTGTITATNVQEALAQLAAQDFRQTTTPTGSNIEEGDTWFNSDTETLSVYRETSHGTYEWVPIMIGNSSPDSDTLDAGAF